MPSSSGPRDVMDVDWAFFGEVCRALAVHVSRDYDPELVLGVAKAGVIPGVVVASLLQREFASMAVTRHDPYAMPQLVAGPPPSVTDCRVLIVDETCDSGETLKLALNEVLALDPAEVRTAVSFRTGRYQPDYFAFETEKLIVLPWDREIVAHGEIVARPDLPGTA